MKQPRFMRRKVGTLRLNSINSRLNYLSPKRYMKKLRINLGFRKTIYQAVTILLIIIRGIIALLIETSPFAVLYLVGRKLYKK